PYGIKYAQTPRVPEKLAKAAKHVMSPAKVVWKRSMQRPYRRIRRLIREHTSPNWLMMKPAMKFRGQDSTKIARWQVLAEPAGSTIAKGSKKVVMGGEGAGEAR